MVFGNVRTPNTIQISRVYFALSIVKFFSHSYFQSIHKGAPRADGWSFCRVATANDGGNPSAWQYATYSLNKKTIDRKIILLPYLQYTIHMRTRKERLQKAWQPAAVDGGDSTNNDIDADARKKTKQNKPCQEIQS